MDFQKLKSQCKSLLATGDDEQCRELLLKHGYFVSQNAKVQKMYLQLFPPTKELERELNSSLKELTSPDAKVRLKAIKYISGKSRGNWTSKNKLWLADPRTIDVLLAALDDPDPNVVRFVINSLGMISKRYEYFDLRIREALISRYRAVDDKLRLEIAQTLPQFGTDRVLDIILDAFACRPSKKACWTVGLAVARHGDSMSPSRRELFLDQLLQAISTQKNIDSVEVMVEGVATLGLKRAIPDLEAVRPKFKNEILQQLFQRTISKLQDPSSWRDPNLDW